MDFIRTLDTNILLYIQEHIRSENFNDFWIFFTSLGDNGILWIITSLVLICFKKTRKIGLVCGVAIFIGALITNITLKNLVARTRPFYAIEGLITLIDYPSDYSFPSGHATSWFAGGMGMFLTVKKRYSFIFLILALLMAFSRLYVGVHYPTDVLAGLIVGTLSAILSYFIVKWIYNKNLFPQFLKDTN